MIVAQYPRTAALVLALLMVAPVFPTAAASHIAGTVDVPILPPAKPTDTCIGVQGAQEVLARLSQMRDPEYGFRDDLGVPSLCGLDGKPVDSWRQTIRTMDNVLAEYRAIAREVQRQADQRLEATLPEGPCQPDDRGVGSAPPACPIVRPEITLLQDRFDGRRIGGFGDWEVISPGGDDPAFYESLTSTLNGTQHTMRFGTQEGYARGAHEWLVSPQVDLRAVTTDPVQAKVLRLAYLQARDTLWGTCTNADGQAPFVYQVCGTDSQIPGSATAPILQGLIQAYMDVIDAETRGIPLGQPSATLDLTFRNNLAFAADGVRVWLWTGEDAPTRIQLYNLSLGTEPGGKRCVPTYEIAVSLASQARNAESQACIDQGGAGKAFLLMGPPGTVSEKAIPGESTKSFQDSTRSPLASTSYAITGDLKDFTTVRVDLSDHAGERVWVMFEVMTTPDAGRGEDYFGDTSRFPRRGDFGFELSQVTVLGHGSLRNLRVNDVASAYERMPRANAFGDTRDVRTTIPPGEDLVARIHNAGGYLENATMRVSFQEQKYRNGVPIGGFEELGADAVRVLNVRPGEAREVPVKWPKSLVEGNLYRAVVSLQADDLENLRVDDTENATDPATTPIRPSNLAESDGNATATLLLRAFTQHTITPIHLPAGTDGPIVEICSEFSAVDGCSALYIANKGQKRILVTGIRNDGSITENVVATLDLKLAGVDKNAAVIDGLQRDVPGLLPSESRVLQWALTPTEPGAYDATIDISLKDGTHMATLHRLVFVERSTGLICLDDLEDDRECGPSFSLTRPAAFREDEPTALEIAPDGTAWAATRIWETVLEGATLEGGALYRQPPGGEWELVQSLKRSDLEKLKLAPARADLEFAPIRAITFNATGTVFLAGDNATLLSRDPDGTMRSYAYQIPGDGPLKAFAGGAEYVIEQGGSVPLAGSVTGGTGGHAIAWTFTAPSETPGATGAFHSTSPGDEAEDQQGFAAHTNFTPTLPRTLTAHDAPVTYHLSMEVTDEAGRMAWGNTTVTVIPRAPDCVREGAAVMTGTLLREDTRDDALPAGADLLCVQVRTATQGGAQKVLVQVTPRELTTGAQYVLKFAGNADSTVTATWTGSAFTVATAGTVPASAITVQRVTDPVDKVQFTIDAQQALLIGSEARMRAINVSATSNGKTDWFYPEGASGTFALSKVARSLAAPTLLVATPSDRAGDRVIVSWQEVPSAAGYAIERSSWDGSTGPWARIASVEQPARPEGQQGPLTVSLTDEGLRPGMVYRYRVAALDKDTLAEGVPASRGAISSVTGVTPLHPRPMHLSATVFNGTLFVGGLRGDMWQLNASAQRLEPIRLSYVSDEATLVQSDGDVLDLLTTADGKRAYAVGEFGRIFTNEGRGAAWQASGWSPAATPDLRGYVVLRSITQLGGQVYVTGSPGVLLASPLTGAFANVTPPELMGGRLDGISAFAGPEGQLFLLAKDGPLRSDGIRGQYVARCVTCDGTDWSYPALPIPSVTRDGTSSRARLLAGSSADGRVVLLGEEGVLLEYARRGVYGNEDDWSVQPPLLVRDGAAYVVNAGSVESDQVLEFTPAAADPSDLVATTGDVADRQGWSSLRITLDQHVAKTMGTAASAPRVRVHYEEIPFVKFPVNNAGSTPCSTDCPTRTRGAIVWQQNLTTSPTAGWDRVVLLAPPPTLDAEVADPQTRAVFSKLDLFVPSLGDVNWAVDAVKVEAYFPDDQEWRPILEWRGPDASTATVTVQPGGIAGTWAPRAEPFNIDAVSPWHISFDLADRPVWVANDEYNAWRAGGTSPHLLNGWDSRLVSPIIDLTEAPDAVISFRHKYAFRMAVIGQTIQTADGGWVELQYEMKGAECGSDDLTATCWSKFYVACPDAPALAAWGGCAAGTGYPSFEMLGYDEYERSSVPSDPTDPYGRTTGPTPNEVPNTPKDKRPARSFWGRSADPDPSGVISGVRATEDYDRVDIVLGDQRISDGQGGTVELNGRRIRVGFHILTNTGDIKWNYTDVFQLTSPTSFPGEGWYVTDLKVRGSRQLGMDLAATNVTLGVGYPLAEIGVGPGTKVPVNVTIENKGRFDVPGYTGELRIDRVVDASRGIVQRVRTETLRQAPLLESGDSRNHTLVWEVPGDVARLSGASTTTTSDGRAKSFVLRDEGDEFRTFSLDAFAVGTGSVRVALILANGTAPDATACRSAGSNTTTVHTIRELTLEPRRQTVRVSEAYPIAQEWQFDALSREARFVLCAQRSGFTGIFQASVAEQADYSVSFVVTPLGIPEDEDPTDNLARAGSVSRPIPSRIAPRFEVELIVTPADATKDITRFLPITLVNTGNVELGGKTTDVQEYFRVTRRILTSSRELVDERSWNTTLPLAAGARASLASLSSEFSLADDLFWKPPSGNDYRIEVTAELFERRAGSLPSRTDGKGAAPAASVDRPAKSFDTYLFDDGELGPRGAGLRGEWEFEPGWAEHGTGFRSAKSYGFGDQILMRYGPGMDSSLVTPIIDLSTARSARFAFYHRYDFEAGFDGGVIEASADGGRTWQRLTPIDRPSIGLQGYNRSLPLAAASPLDEDKGDPLTRSLAFTGDSREIAPASDGWVLSIFDLTEFPSIREENVPYEMFDASALLNYKGNGTTDDLFRTTEGAAREYPTASTRTYFETSWRVGRPDEYRYWEVQNLTQDVVHPIVGNDFWYSGSMSIQDDAMRPLNNTWLVINVSHLPANITKEDRVVAEWWEWQDRYNMYDTYIEASATENNRHRPDDFRGVFAWTDGGGTTPVSHRFNVSKPTILEQNGRWVRLQADLKEFLVPTNGYPAIESIEFVYAPVKTDITTAASATPEARAALESSYANDTNNYKPPRYMDDRGVVIDGFFINASKVVGGQVTDQRSLMTEDDAWGKYARLQVCQAGAPAHVSNDLSFLPCFQATASGDRLLQTVLAPAALNAPPAVLDESWKGPVGYPGRTWTKTNSIPGIPAGWQVVDIMDKDLHYSGNPLPTGERPVAWYSGSFCQRENLWYDRSLCIMPQEESRLVTPALDLGTIAGTTAKLTFDHRYLFHIETAGLFGAPFASGGVVEIQVYDEETDTWSPWKQLYADGGEIYKPLDPKIGQLQADIGPSGDRGRANAGYRGGYSAYTSNTSFDQGGHVVRLDSPFDSIPTYDEERRMTTTVQFLYSGRSAQVNGNSNGWVPASFDLRDYIGEKVRIGFHMSLSGASRSSQNASDDANYVNTALPENDALRNGWWITNIGVVGKVLNGAPVQLRARAVSDGNVGDGVWQFDDAGVFGSQYGDNIGLFLEDAKLGGVAGTNVTLNVTLRNLGSSVRPNLAFEIKELGADVVTLKGAVAPAVDLVDDNEVLRASGFTLAPGQSVTVPIRMAVAAELPAGSVPSLLFLEAKEFNAAEKRFVKITGNEVQGFLRRQVPFVAQRNPIVDLSLPRALQAAPLPGAPLDILVDVENKGYAAVALNVSCQADPILGHTAVDHKADPLARLEVGGTIPCDLVSGPATLAPLQKAALTYRLQPRSPGSVLVQVNGSFAVGGSTFAVSKPVTLTVLVGTPSLLYQESFDDPRSVLENFTGKGSFGGATDAAQWEYLRGHERPGSLRIGSNETQLGGGTYSCAVVTCVAVTPPIDLHNFTKENLILSFWQQKRLAPRDGAQVTVQFLIDETKPDSVTSWSTDWCLAEPRGGYDRDPAVYSEVADAQGQPPSEDIFYKDWKELGSVYQSPRYDDNGAEIYPAEFFTSKGFDDGWTRVAFDLGKQLRTCDPDGPRPTERMPILGHTVRFVFSVYGALNAEGRARGPGHAWLIDDISLSTAGVSLGPSQVQRATLLDNSTKTFNIVVTNDGDQPDLVRLKFDEASSSAPAGSVRAPTEPIALAARERRIVPIEVQLPRDPSLLPTQFKARIRGESLLDRMAYATTDLQFDFAPRQWAELSVAAQAPRSTVQEGTETFIGLTIENTGIVESVPTRVRIVDRVLGDTRAAGPCPAGGGTVDGVTCIDLAPMPSYFQDADQASRVLEFRWRPEKGSVGIHTLTIEVDPDEIGEEYTRTNNVATLQVAVSELLLPDVDVAAAEALHLRNAVGQLLEPLKEGGVTRYESTAGELVTLEVKVINKGKAAATNVDVRAFVGPLSLPARTIPFIAPGNEVSLTFNWVAQKGDYPLEVVARSEQVELSTTNNRNPEVGVTLLVVKGYEVSVRLADLEGILEPGTEVKVPFNVTNSGNAGEEIRIVPRVPEGWTATVPRAALFLRAGETYGAEATVVVPTDAVAGEQFISVDAIARSNAMKAATGSAKGVVRAFHEGSVGSTLARGAPPVLVLPIELTNDGNSLEPWTIRVDLPAGWTARETLPAKVVVPAHGTTTIPLHVTLPLSVPPGDRTIGVHATLPDGTRRDGTIDVKVDALRAAIAKVVDERPREAQGSLSYPVVIENVGNVEQPFEVVLLEEQPGLTVRLEPSTFKLAPGSKAVATLTLTPRADAPTGALQLAAYSAFAGVVPDTSEGRANQQRLQVSVMRPDLRVSPLDYAKAGVDTGERVVVKVPITNDGQATVTDLPVHLFVDDVFIGEARVAKLAPGETRDVTLNWTALPGKHTVTAVVDPYRDTIDAERADNTVSGIVEVKSAAIRGISGGAKVPFDGLLLIAIALCAAIVLTPRNGARRPPR